MSVALPIPQHFTCTYFFLPYQVSKKIFQCEVYVRMSDSIMAIKQKMADHASTFYQTNVGPYDFVIAQIDKQDFSFQQIFPDDSSSSLLNVNSNNYYIFAL
jgi:hypothetical protein